MKILGTVKVKNLDHSMVPAPLTKPLDHYKFRAIDKAVDGSGYLCFVCDGKEAICVADIRNEDIETFTPAPIMPNTLLTDIMDMFEMIESDLPGEL
jgi:hypothetical protein